MEVSRLRALANTVGPAIPESLVKDTQSYAAFVLSSARKKKSRSQEGDNLHDRPLCVLANDGMINVAFTSIFQGDHAGVEFATSAHEGFLHSFGCLSPCSRMISSKPLCDSSHAQGIDDYYAVSIEPLVTPASETWSKQLLDRA